MGTFPARQRPTPARIRTIQLLLLILAGILSYGVLVLPLALRPAALPLKAGDVAPNDFQAPRSIRYASTVRTEEARLAAENAVAPVYGSPDPAIARRQIERLRTTLQYITLTRDDSNSTPEQKTADLAALDDVILKPSTIDQILALPSARWDVIQQESLSVLEQVMRRSLRDVDVDTVRRSVPSLVSLSLNEEQAAMVAELVSAYVTANSEYSADLTEAAKRSAREAVQPVAEEYKSGEIIVLRGQLITPAQIETLQQFGLIEEARPWEAYAGAGALVIMLGAYISLYFSRRRLPFLLEARSLVVVAVLFLIFLAGARVTIPNRTVVPYAYPLPALGLIISTLFGVESGIVFSFAMALLAPYSLPNALDLMPYYLATSLTGVLVLGSARRVWTFFRAGAAITAAGIAMLIAFRLPFTPTDGIAVLQLTGAAIFNGLGSSGLALVLQYFLAQSLGLTTALQLIEISRPDFPLLQYFLRNAPGTYQHSLQVANLAEQAAEAIGADALLTRVGALFHDVGKSVNPMFFIENQPQGEMNTHEDIDPVEAAAAIIAHVNDGVALARKHRLPRRIDDFILEHHGTMVARYQYTQALEMGGGDPAKVDIEKFRYPGPRPRSRETALLMLADGSEARTRAQRPQNEDELRKVVLAAIESAQKQGQLDNTPLTARDLSAITDAFVTVLRGAYHPRITYPKEGAALDTIVASPQSKK
jgi:putative nucleotidyltransferase with HDIG domain